MLFLSVKSAELTIYFNCDHLILPLEALRSGKVLDASEGSLFRRVWRVGSELHFAYQMGHDVAWTHNVFIFALPNGDCGAQYPLRVQELHKYLAEGNGIPAAST